MNFKTFAAILIVLLIAGIASAAYATFQHSAFKIGDGKDINLMGQAVGNGTTKDLYCSSNCTGQFNVTSISTETNASNLTVGRIPSEDRLPNTSMGVINASRYATIQDAINQTSASGGTVRVGKGIFNTGFLKLYNGTILEGEGNLTILRLSDGAYANGSTLEKDSYIRLAGVDDTDPYTTTYNVGIKNLVVDANRQGQTGVTANDLYGIQLLWSYGAEIDNVEIKNAYSSGIVVFPSRSSVNPSLNKDGKNILTKIRAHDNGVGAQALDAGILISCCGQYNASQRVILSNSFAYNNSNGIVIEDAASGDVTIDNVQVYNNTHYGIGLQTVKYISISNSISKWNEYGIGSISPIGERFITLTGNQFIGNSKYGIEYRGSGWAILGNIIRENEYSGIWSDGYEASITGNTINANGKNASAPNRAGIYFMNNPSNGNKVVGNTIGRDPSIDTDESQQYGIQEGEAITIGVGTIAPNIYSLNTLNYNVVSGLLQNTTSTGSSAFDNSGAPGFNWGNRTTAPTNPYGFRDTYQNGTSLDLSCGYDGSNWKNATGDTTVC